MPHQDNEDQREENEERTNQISQGNNQAQNYPERDSMGEELTDGEPRENDIDDDEDDEEEDNRQL